MNLPIYINYPDNIFSFQRDVIQFLNTTTKILNNFAQLNKLAILYTVPLMARCERGILNYPRVKNLIKDRVPATVGNIISSAIPSSYQFKISQFRF